MQMPVLALVKTEEKMPPVMNEWASHAWYESWYWAMMAFYTYGFSLRTEGHDNVPKRGAALLLANHTSFLDPMGVGLAARRHLTYLARKTLFTGNKLLGRFLDSVNCVPVDQEGVATEGIKTIIRELMAGKAVLVFPGGRAHTDGENDSAQAGRSSHYQTGAGADHSRRYRRCVRRVPADGEVSEVFADFSSREQGLYGGVGRQAARRPALTRKCRGKKALKELFDEIQEMQLKAERLRRKPL